MSIPVIVAVGHTSDTSLLDDVAKLPCKTPSDAAHAIGSLYNQMLHAIDSHRNEINELSAKKYRMRMLQINTLQRQIHHDFLDHIRQSKERIETIMREITSLCPATHYAQGYVSLHTKTKEQRATIPDHPEFPLYLFDGKKWLRIDSGEVE